MFRMIMDPWTDCRRLYDEHFLDRMDQRFLTRTQVNEALIDGIKTRESKDDYKIKWKLWTLKVSLKSCFVYLWTAYRGH